MQFDESPSSASSLYDSARDDRSLARSSLSHASTACVHGGPRWCDRDRRCAHESIASFISDELNPTDATRRRHTIRRSPPSTNTERTHADERAYPSAPRVCARAIGVYCARATEPGSAIGVATRSEDTRRGIDRTSHSRATVLSTLCCRCVLECTPTLSLLHLSISSRCTLSRTPRVHPSPLSRRITPRAASSARILRRHAS
jgi:hypothetical protein